jgi:fucose permease
MVGFMLDTIFRNVPDEVYQTGKASWRDATINAVLLLIAVFAKGTIAVYAVIAVPFLCQSCFPPYLQWESQVLVKKQRLDHHFL